ncbi:hypothetical protein V565_088490 [Rhizoctonia solani 123E]|uniref:HNH nuclease domain-containing protein n=1 Tax=Rhizoctonia solani 123E TaxID=1423351 RepID=A0A074RXF3_9AGAM|nr:hypothetical protein V565_088490 [Rhizoctonia solani 123E]
MATPTPLPPLSNLFQGVEAARTAYERILPMENENPVLIRILGWMLIHAPNVDGRAHVAQGINQCLNSSKIIELGKHHFQYFVKYFKATANKPTQSSHPSRPSIDTLRDLILDSLDEPPANHSQAEDRALFRDNYRCQLTGRLDSKAWKNSPTVRAQSDANPVVGIGQTECHHILPQYIGHHITSNESRCMNTATVWSIVHSFGGIPSIELNGAGIHHLRNIMTLRADI